MSDLDSELNETCDYEVDDDGNDGDGDGANAVKCTEENIEEGRKITDSIQEFFCCLKPVHTVYIIITFVVDLQV